MIFEFLSFNRNSECLHPSIESKLSVVLAQYPVCGYPRCVDSLT